ncbi:MAG: MFS transporter [Actinomycetales bacterium]|nr:MFS transporter [Actinomycetales bacterium]
MRRRPPGALPQGEPVLADPPCGAAGHEGSGGPVPTCRPVGTDTPAEQPSATRPRLHRDALTATGYVFLSTWGWFLYAFGVLVPLLREAQGTSRAVGALHSTALATGSLVAGFAATALVRRLHRRGTAFLAAGLVAAGLCPLLVGTPTWLTLTATLITGTGGAILVNTTTPFLLEHHGPAGPAAISEGNAAASALALLAPLTVGVGIGAGMTWRPAFLAVPVFLGLGLLVLRRVPRGTPAVDAQAPVTTAGSGSRLPHAFWPPAVVVVLCLGVEFSVATWSADLLRQRTGLGAGGATAAVSIVVGGMMIGRLIVGRLTLLLPIRTLVIGSVLLAGVGWAITWTATGPAQALTGLAVTGLGIAGHYPLGMSLALAGAPGQGDRATGTVSIAAAFSVGSAPFALGALADATDIRTAFLVVPLLLLITLLVLLVNHRTGTPTDPRTGV